jgi:hypothetical protein
VEGRRCLATGCYARCERSERLALNLLGGFLMNIQWIITPDDVKQIRDFVSKYSHDPFVKLRERRNITDRKPIITKDNFWQVMVSCLLTTQQRSGPESPIKALLDIRPFPFSYSECCSRQNLRSFVSRTLSQAEGIRRFNKIADEVHTNFYKLESKSWEPTLEICNELRSNSNPLLERQASHYIDDELKGFGPKQSRNLLQWLGLTRYEIPIDSRITKWLNQFGFPIRLSASALSDKNYYDFISDGIQALCAETGIYPCILDAAIFTSYDKGGWTEENLQSEDVVSA